MRLVREDVPEGKERKPRERAIIKEAEADVARAEVRHRPKDGLDLRARKRKRKKEEYSLAINQRVAQLIII
jgi:hypothetical protein